MNTGGIIRQPTSIFGDAKMSAAPKRSIDFLSADQLRRKREGDRRSQRLLRERTKAHVLSLENRVRELETQVQALEQELSSRKPECTCQSKSNAEKDGAARKPMSPGLGSDLLLTQSDVADFCQNEDLQSILLPRGTDFAPQTFGFPSTQLSDDARLMLGELCTRMKCVQSPLTLN